jgi:capsular polysaccharide biosynthesis protein
VNNSSREETEIDLLRLAQVLWQHIVIIISVMVICAAAGYAIAAFVIAPTYSASADMIVNNQQDQTQSTAVTTGDLSASSTLVDTYAVILKSHTILEQVITDLNLDTTYDALADSITVTAVDSTQVMRITVKAGSSEEAMQIVSRIVELAPDAIMDTVNAGSVKTVDTPWTSGKPVSPSKSKFTALAGLLGLVVSCGIIILRELMNNTFQTEEDVRKVLGLQVLGVIPLEELGMKKGGTH